MRIVNMAEARSTLSRLVRALEDGREDEIVIARSGRAVARIVPLQAVRAEKRIGIARGWFVPPDDMDTENAEVGALFTGSGE